MPYEIRTTRRVEFAETDKAGIVHFSNFFRYMEEAEHAFLRAIGTSVVAHVDGTELSWPRVSASCDFRAPAFFEDVLDVHLWVAHKGTKSVRYRALISRGGTVLAHGRLASVCCRCEAGLPMKPIPIPPELRPRIELAPYGDEPACWTAATGVSP
jgi:4-hydroxybenzoyl-CoA thioesterase/acyl-CoA thioester hydrolase